MAGHKGKGESVMLTQLLTYSLDLWADVAEHRGDRARAGRYRKAAEECRKAVNKYAWDGGWYVRGFTDAGKPFGSKKNREGKIWCNAQNWAIISGAATGERLTKSVKAVERYLVEPSGTAMLGPAYTPFHEDIGKVTIKNPGIDENGAVYNSASCWWALALLWARMPDKGWKATRVMLPGGKGNTNTLKRAKQLPLYIPNFYKGEAVGSDAGESSRYPSTGTISWYYYMVIAYLMGVRGELDGLRIDPQIPSHWKKARVWRRWRGAEFDIEIARSHKVNKTEVTLDGAKVPGNLIPVQKPRTRHKVKVTISG
jgi:cellobionic acid phosphorylase